MDTSYRSRRAELAALRAELEAKGAPIRQIASLIRVRYRLGARTAYRYAHGLTQQQVADRWNQLWPPADGAATITHKHISYWEAWPLRTGRPPSVETLNRLARIYETSAAELLDGEDYTNVGNALVPGGVAPAAGDPSTSGIVQVEPSDVLTRVDRFIATSDTLVTRESAYHQLVKDLIEWAFRMKRRDILQWLSSAAAAAAAAPVLDGLDPDERYRVVAAFARPERVDASVIEHIEAVLWRCRRQDDALGPQAALDTVLAQRNLIRGLLPVVPSEHRDRLLSVYAGLSALLGWLSFDLTNYPASSDYYETARAAAHEAHNTALGAHILCNMSQIATWRGQARIGIDHAVAALGWAIQTDDLPLQAYAHDVAARAYAADSNQQASHHAIDQARTTLTRADPAAATLVYFYSPGELANSESWCHLQLREPKAAERAAAVAVTAINPGFVRNLAMASLRLGACRLQLDQPDVAGAAEATSNAVELAAHNRSRRVVDELHRNWQALEPWRDVTEVAAVRDRMVAYGLV